MAFMVRACALVAYTVMACTLMAFCSYTKASDDKDDNVASYAGSDGDSDPDDHDNDDSDVKMATAATTSPACARRDSVSKPGRSRAVHGADCTTILLRRRRPLVSLP